MANTGDPGTACLEYDKGGAGNCLECEFGYILNGQTEDRCTLDC